MESTTEKHRRQIRWRIRRGAKELDLILAAFVDARYDALSAAERRALDRLLRCADPQLTDWLCHGASPADHELAALVERIRAAHRG